VRVASSCEEVGVVERGERERALRLAAGLGLSPLRPEEEVSRVVDAGLVGVVVEDGLKKEKMPVFVE
jgi:hypothetical protein